MAICADSLSNGNVQLLHVTYQLKCFQETLQNKVHNLHNFGEGIQKNY